MVKVLAFSLRRVYLRAKAILISTFNPMCFMWAYLYHSAVSTFMTKLRSIFAILWDSENKNDIIGCMKQSWWKQVKKSSAKTER